MPIATKLQRYSVRVDVAGREKVVNVMASSTAAAASAAVQRVQKEEGIAPRVLRVWLPAK